MLELCSHLGAMGTLDRAQVLANSPSHSLTWKQGFLDSL